MEYRAVGNRCAVVLDSLNVPISEGEILAILNYKGFLVIGVDIILLARQCIGVSQYSRGIHSSKAPAVVDCSSFVKWIYGMRGIWLPRRSIQQHKVGKVINLNEIRAGDLLFTTSWVNYYVEDRNDGIGHVGMVTGEETVIHARRGGVTESPLERFVGKNKFRGARRYVPTDREVLTLVIPENREVETSDDIRWIILESLPEKK